MAAYENTRALAGSQAFGSLSNFAHSITSALATWNDKRTTRNSLSKLSDRELEDIGLSRSVIEDVVSRHTL